MNIENILSLVSEYIQEKDKIRNPFRAGIDVVPVSGATITSDDVTNVVKAAMGRWYTEGEYHKKFSHELQTLLGGSRRIALCNSGSSALLLATSACKEYFHSLKGSYVITCATGFPTTIAPAIQLGFSPYFVDINIDTLNADPTEIVELLDRDDVSGVVLAHTLGFPYDASIIRDKANKAEKFFIEDCSDAIGATIGNIPVGTFGHASTFSFFPAHHITTGEGGAVSYFNGRLAKIGNSYNNWGRDCWCKPGDSDTCNKRFGWKWDNLPNEYDHKYTFTRLGYNLKMTELQAALGYSQIQRLSHIRKWRWDNFLRLYINLYGICKEHLKFVNWDFDDITNIDPSPFGFPITVVTNAFTKNELVAYLENNKIATRSIFGGNLARQPMMDSVPFSSSGMKNSDFVMNNSFWIGCHEALTKSHIDYICDCFYHFFHSRGL